MKVKHIKLLSNVALKCKLRHYNEGWRTAVTKEFDDISDGGALQVHPRLTPDSPRLTSTLEPQI